MRARAGPVAFGHQRTEHVDDAEIAALPEMANGEYVADLIVSLGSLDIVLGNVDR